MKRSRIWLAGLCLALAGCTHRPPPASPQPLRPTVDRAVLALSAADRTARGNIVIPTDSIVDYAGLPGVFVLDAHGRARFRLIKIGKPHDGTSEILSGLEGNETLVLPPFQGVFDGSPVHVIRTKGSP